jgi:hypothetical protein
MIKLFEKLHWARRVKLPTPKQLASKAAAEIKVRRRVLGS